jgi:hypothetical protein
MGDKSKATPTQQPSSVVTQIESAKDSGHYREQLRLPRTLDNSEGIFAVDCTTYGWRFGFGFEEIVLLMASGWTLRAAFEEVSSGACTVINRRETWCFAAAVAFGLLFARLESQLLLLGQSAD